jgi:hypothetical protein
MGPWRVRCEHPTREVPCTCLPGHRCLVTSMSAAAPHPRVGTKPSCWSGSATRPRAGRVSRATARAPPADTSGTSLSRTSGGSIRRAEPSSSARPDRTRSAPRSSLPPTGSSSVAGSSWVMDWRGRRSAVGGRRTRWRRRVGCALARPPVRHVGGSRSRNRGLQLREPRPPIGSPRVETDEELHLSQWWALPPG